MHLGQASREETTLSQLGDAQAPSVQVDAMMRIRFLYPSLPGRPSRNRQQRRWMGTYVPGYLEQGGRGGVSSTIWIFSLIFSSVKHVFYRTLLGTATLYLAPSGSTPLRFWSTHTSGQATV